MRAACWCHALHRARADRRPHRRGQAGRRGPAGRTPQGPQGPGRRVDRVERLRALPGARRARRTAAAGAGRAPRTWRSRPAPARSSPTRRSSPRSRRPSATSQVAGCAARSSSPPGWRCCGPRWRGCRRAATPTRCRFPTRSEARVGPGTSPGTLRAAASGSSSSGRCGSASRYCVNRPSSFGCVVVPNRSSRMGAWGPLVPESWTPHHQQPLRARRAPAGRCGMERCGQ